jgi:hypothetical protein
LIESAVALSVVHAAKAQRQADLMVATKVTPAKWRTENWRHDHGEFGNARQTEKARVGRQPTRWGPSSKTKPVMRKYPIT